MDLRHVCYLIAESVNRTGGEPLGDEPGAVSAEVSLLGESAGVVRLAVEGEEFLVLVQSAVTPDAVVPSVCEET